MDSIPGNVLSETINQVSSKQTRDMSVVSSIPDGDEFSQVHRSTLKGKGFSSPPSFRYALLIAALVAAGSYSILPLWLFMCRLWINDPLRAIGAVFPLLAFTGTLAAWRRIGWTLNGTFWGLPILALSILLAPITTSGIMVLRVHLQHNEPMLHPGVVMFLYAVGAVFLFGGFRLLRAAIAPLCLLLFINPVPGLFNVVVDYPLQFLSATTARHFSHLIGLHPTGEQLRMMFTPDFGMMIVPGCNGVRGSVTLGYLALIFGYIRHLRPRTLALTTLAAFLSGYLFNLLRLCILVIYYRIGVSVPSIQKYGAGVDYVIGCTLFLFATLGVGLFIRWVEPDQPPAATAAAVTNNVGPFAGKLGYAAVARTICFVVLVLIFIVPALHGGTSLRMTQPSEQALFSSFPPQVGPYRLERTYSESANGTIRFVFGEYAAPPDAAGDTKRIALGLYVGPNAHLVAYSRFVQGVRPDWTSSLDTSDASVPSQLKVHFVTTSYNDGITHEFDAESICYEVGCSATLNSSANNLFLVSPKLSNLIFSSTGKSLPIVLRREWLDTDGVPTAVQRSQFEADARQFTEKLDLRTLFREDGILQ